MGASRANRILNAFACCALGAYFGYRSWQSAPWAWGLHCSFLSSGSGPIGPTVRASRVNDMAKSYLFLKPTALPLSGEDMTAESVSPIDPEEVAACLTRALPSLAWSSPTEASGDVDAGWIEFSQPGEGATRSLALRCSLRSDYVSFVQGLCDQFGWVAFDDTPLMFQPHRPPDPV